MFTIPVRPANWRLAVTLAVLASFGLASCGGGGASPSAPAPVTPTVTAVAVTGIGAPTVGATAQATATATLSDGTTQSVTTQATWQSTNTGVVTVSASGMVTAVSSGEVDISATYRSATGTAHVSVAARPLERFPLTGTVTDRGSGRLVSSATVEIRDGPDAARSAVTDGIGRYVLSDVAEGRITLRVSARDFETVTLSVTVAGATIQDLVISPSANVTAFYGTYSVRFTIQQDQCDVPVFPGPQGQLTLSGRQDGSQMTATIVERGTTRNYNGSMRTDGAFTSSSSGVFAGISSPIVNKHDFTGNLSGTVSGRSVAATETITYGAPCPGKTARFGIDGSR